MRHLRQITLPLLLTLTFGGSLIIPVVAQDSVAAKKNAGDLDLSKFPGQVMEDVLIPVPSEIFGVLEKLGDPDWRKEITPGTKVKFSDRTDVALQLGTVVADGFLAVQAQDAKTVEAIGRDVLELSKALGVKEAVLPHCNAIQEAAKSKDWDTVRRELDSTQRTVRDTMDKMKDKALAECVSVGGWLRGTQVVTSVIKASYTEDKAELLNQPELVDYFRKSIAKAMTKLPKTEKLKLIAKGLGDIHDLMNSSSGNLNQNAVASINRITAELVAQMTSKN